MELIIKRFEDLTTCELYDLLRVRVSVFVVEQNCPYQELDGRDMRAWHVFYRKDGQIQAYLRVLVPDQPGGMVSIGRVLTVKRGSGLGRALMLEGIRIAKEKLGADSVCLAAQVYARGFYERLGFAQTSGEFMDDGIPHIEMTLALQSGSAAFGGAGGGRLLL